MSKFSGVGVELGYSQYDSIAQHTGYLSYSLLYQLQFGYYNLKFIKTGEKFELAKFYNFKSDILVDEVCV